MHTRVGVLLRVVRISEEALAFCADVVHLLVMLLEMLACTELLCAYVC